jgi:hypothetical protein
VWVPFCSDILMNELANNPSLVRNARLYTKRRGCQAVATSEALDLVRTCGLPGPRFFMLGTRTYEQPRREHVVCVRWLRSFIICIDIAHFIQLVLGRPLISFYFIHTAVIAVYCKYSGSAGITVPAHNLTSGLLGASLHGLHAYPVFFYLLCSEVR